MSKRYERARWLRRASFTRPEGKENNRRSEETTVFRAGRCLFDVCVAQQVCKWQRRGVDDFVESCFYRHSSFTGTASKNWRDCRALKWVASCWRHSGGSVVLNEQIDFKRLKARKQPPPPTPNTQHPHRTKKSSKSGSGCVTLGYKTKQKKTWTHEAQSVTDTPLCCRCRSCDSRSSWAPRLCVRSGPSVRSGSPHKHFSSCCWELTAGATVLSSVFLFFPCTVRS